MSSATSVNMGRVGSSIRSGAMPAPVDDEQVAGPTQKLSRRQIDLDRLWRYYRCTVYEGRKYNWNGREQLPHIEHDVVARSGNIPPGFYDAGGAMVPLEFRAPSAPYFLPRVIVNRFTSLLFSKHRHPKVESDDPETEEWLTGFIEATRLWSVMIRARSFGGAMGTVALGFKIQNGSPTVEVHDPRWCTPVFKDRETQELKKFIKMYQYPMEKRDSSGSTHEKWYWYRREITERSDTVWDKIEVESNSTPRWDKLPCKTYQHDFGFCPVVWVQNQHVDDSVDGDPDCHGIFELSESVDGLWSQAQRGTIANCDPSLLISSDADFDEIKKGSGNAIQLEKGGSAQYMEMQGSGIDKAMALAEKLEERALTVARCMLDRNEGGPSRTVAEIEHNYSSMIEQADILREQYGERGIKPLLRMVLRAARAMSTPIHDPDTNRVVSKFIKLPKKRISDPATNKTVGWKERVLGNGEELELNWPPYFQPSSKDASSAVEAAARAREAKILDTEHAVGYIATYFGVENRADLVKKIKAEAKEESELAMGAFGGGGGTMGDVSMGPGVEAPLEDEEAGMVPEDEMSDEDLAWSP